MPRYIIPSSHRVTKAKERLAAAKLHNAISVERLGSANEMQQSSKAALELAQKSMETAIRNKEEAIEQLRITQKEMKEAEQTLVKAEQEKSNGKKKQTILHQTKNNTTQKYGVGTAVSKEFYDKDIDKFRSFSGKVISYNSNNMLYRIRYEDDDEEDLNEKKLAKIVIGNGISSKHSKKRKRSTELASNDKNPKAKKKNSIRIKKKEGQKSIEYFEVNLDADHPHDLFQNGYHIQVDLNDNHPPWQATIIKRRERLGVLGYDIHYHGLKSKHWIKYDKIVAVHFPKEDDKKTSEEDLSKEDEEQEETSETTSQTHLKVGLDS